MNGLKVLERTYRHLNRYREVAAVLSKHGLADLLHALHLDEPLETGLENLLKRRTFIDPASRPERVRLALQDLGPAFIKAGQYLSTRSDLLPADYLRALSKLQDSVPPFAAQTAEEIVKEDLGACVDKLFKGFERQTMAAASIAQIHEAELKEGGRVVVKVERPDIRRIVTVDLEIMSRLSLMAERHLEHWRWRKPRRIVAEIARSLDREMDFSIEASHAERFARQFRGEATVRVPKVHRDLSSTRVLTLEKIEGTKVDDLEALRREGLDPRIVAERLAGHYLAMIFVHGFFHADPHPGNLLVLPGHVIGYLDFGMMGRLDRPTREALADVVLAVVEADGEALCRGLLALADYDQEPDQRSFQADIADIMDQYAYRPVKEWSLGRAFQQFFDTTTRYRVRVPAELFMMVKALSELESLTRLLDPSFDAVAAAAPVIRQVHAQRLKPRRLAQDLAEAGRQTLKLFSSAPADLREILRQARRGRFLIEFEHKGLDPALSTLDHVSNRLSFSILLGSIIIGSSLLLKAAWPADWQGAAAVGLGGFVLAVLMALWLIAAILKHGRL